MFTKGDCTPGLQRRVARWEHEDLLDEMQARVDHAPEMMRIRRQTVEHPFGTIKAWMGANHFLTRTIERVSTEMSLHVLAYNMKRVIKLLGSEALINAMRAWGMLPVQRLHRTSSVIWCSDHRNRSQTYVVQTFRPRWLSVLTRSEPGTDLRHPTEIVDTY